MPGCLIFFVPWGFAYHSYRCHEGFIRCDGFLNLAFFRRSQRLVNGFDVPRLRSVDDDFFAGDDDSLDLWNSWQLITVAIQNRQLHLTTFVDAADNWQLLKLTAVATYYWKLFQLTTDSHTWHLLQLKADNCCNYLVKFERCLGLLIIFVIMV